MHSRPLKKVLKAFLVFHGRDLSKTHDLVALLALCVESHPGLAVLESDCRQLTSYGVAAYRVRTKILAVLPDNR